MSELANRLYEMGERAKAAARELAVTGTEAKDAALLAMARALRESAADIISENAADLEAARKNGMSASMTDRLALNEARIEEMAKGLEDVAKLRDPIGMVTDMWTVDNGLRVGRVRVPLGVIGIIYEARPNVTADVAGLCLKSGNAVILRGGREAMRSNIAITNALCRAAGECGIHAGAIQLLDDPSREASVEIMRLQAIDVLIPRGGPGLKKAVLENARISYIMTGDGNCHTFIDKSADADMAVEILLNEKVQRPAVCNSVETLLVHRDISEWFLPMALKELSEYGVEIRGDNETVDLFPAAKPASEEDWAAEYDDLIIAVRVVGGIDEAMEHIARYGTKHSEAIITEDYSNAQKFLAGVDAAAVYVNASTRFTDGGCFGFGAEMGISTQKLHARGPMGLEQLTSIKYIVYGSGQIRGKNPDKPMK